MMRSWRGWTLLPMMIGGFLMGPSRAGFVEYGDEDLLNTGRYSSDPKAGATLTGLASGIATLATHGFGHGYPFAPSAGEYAGTDRIYVGADQTAFDDGYSRYAGRARGPQVITLDYTSLVPAGTSVGTLTLGIGSDDFQQPVWGNPFSATIDGEFDPALSGVLNSLNETGPIKRFFSIGIDPSVLSPDHILTLNIGEGGNGGDGWAIDFLTIGVTTRAVPSPSGLPLIGSGFGLISLASLRRLGRKRSDRGRSPLDENLAVDPSSFQNHGQNDVPRSADVPHDPFAFLEPALAASEPLRAIPRKKRGRALLACALVAGYVAAHLAISGTFFMWVRSFTKPPKAAEDERVLSPSELRLARQVDPRAVARESRAEAKELPRESPRVEVASLESTGANRPSRTAPIVPPPPPTPAEFEVAAVDPSPRPDPPQVAEVPVVDDASDPRRQELNRCVLIYENKASEFKDKARKTLEATLASAVKRRDAKGIEHTKGSLRELNDQGRIPGDSMTRPQLNELRKEEDLLQKVFERIEKSYAEDNDKASAARVRRECDDFVNRLCSTDDDRNLRTHKLTRRGKYYVLADVEATGFRKFEEADLVYKRLQAAYQDALAIHVIDKTLSDAYDIFVSARALVLEIDNQIAGGGLKGAELRYAQNQRTKAEDARILARRDFDIALKNANEMSPLRRHEAQKVLDEKLHEHRDSLLELRPALKEVAGSYRAIATPEVRKHLDNLGLGLGPSEAYRDMLKVVQRAEKELKDMNIHLRPAAKREPKL